MYTKQCANGPQERKSFLDKGETIHCKEDAKGGFYSKSGIRSVLILDQALRSLKISIHHLPHKGVEIDLALPPKQLLSFIRVTQQKPISDQNPSANPRNQNVTAKT